MKASMLKNGITADKAPKPNVRALSFTGCDLLLSPHTS